MRRLAAAIGNETQQSIASWSASSKSGLGGHTLGVAEERVHRLGRNGCLTRSQDSPF